MYGLQAFRSNRLHSHQGTPDASLAHSVQERRIFSRFHGDLRKEDGVVGEFRKSLHEFKTLRAQAAKFGRPRGVHLPFGQSDISQRHGVKIIVGERDDTVTNSAELHDLVHYRVGRALSRFLAVGAPYRTEGAMFRAAANGLDGRPHITIGGKQIPARRAETVGTHPAAVVQGLRLAAGAVGKYLGPDQVAIALHHGVRLPELLRFIRVKTRMNAAEDDECSAGTRQPANLKSAQRIGSVDADPNDVARLYVFGTDRFERL